MPLTPLSEAELDMILPWRNAPAVRRAMLSHHEITPEEHRAWFQRLSGDPHPHPRPRRQRRRRRPGRDRHRKVLHPQPCRGWRREVMPWDTSKSE